MENEMPFVMVIHDNRSAKMLKSFGADRSPKGKHVSMKILFCHSMARRCLSAGWTGNNLNALLMSILAIRVLGPNSRILLIASSTVIYDSPHNDFGIPSLTLYDLGCERSTISLHLSGWWDLGITPNLLICIPGRWALVKGPATLFRVISLSKYSSTTSGCCIALPDSFWKI